MEQWGCDRCANCIYCTNEDIDEAIRDSEELAWPSEEEEEDGQENKVFDLTRSNAGVWVDTPTYKDFMLRGREIKKKTPPPKKIRKRLEKD